MTNYNISVAEQLDARDESNAQVRFSFTARFIGGSVLLTRRAKLIESDASASVDDKTEHMALVVAAITQCAASIECALAEVLMHGPSNRSGSNSWTPAEHARAREQTQLSNGRAGVIKRWNILLARLEKEELDESDPIVEDAKLLIGLRNELVHYKSNWDGEMTKPSLLAGLRAKRFERPPFMNPGLQEFPLLILSAACGTWACGAAAAYLDTVFARLDEPSVLDGHRLPPGELSHLMPPRRP